MRASMISFSVADPLSDHCSGRVILPLKISGLLQSKFEIFSTGKLRRFALEEI